MTLTDSLANILGENITLDNEGLTVNIKNRQNTVFQSQALAVSSENEIGKFDVLSQHANFISLIKKSVTIKRKNAPDFSIPIDLGIMKVWENQVFVYLDVFSNLKI